MAWDPEDEEHSLFREAAEKFAMARNDCPNHHCRESENDHDCYHPNSWGSGNCFLSQCPRLRDIAVYAGVNFG